MSNNKKKKSTRFNIDVEEQLVPDLMTQHPLVPPPPAVDTKKISSKNDQQRCIVEMPQEDRFFFNDDYKKEDMFSSTLSNTNSTYDTINKRSMSDSSLLPLWPPLDSGNPFPNPFEDTNGQPILTDEPLEYDFSKVNIITQELEDNEEKQELKEDANNTPSTTVNSTPNISNHDDDSDREFDWNDDPDQVELKRRKTARERFTAAMQKPCCWSHLTPLVKRIIIAVIGSCIFIVIAVVINITLPKPTSAQLVDPNFTNIRSNVQCWMYWAAFMWHIFWISTFLLDSVPSVLSLWTKLFIGRRSERVKSYMESYMSLKSYFGLVTLASWNLGSWAFLIDYPFDSIKKHSYSLVVTRTFGCLLAAAGLLFVQKSIIQLIATQFHRTAFHDRLKENKQSLKYLDTLSKSEKKARHTGTPYASDQNLRHRRRSLKRNTNSQWGFGDIHSSNDEHTDSSNHHPNSRMTTLTDMPPRQRPAFATLKQRLSKAILTDTPAISTTTGRVKTSHMDVNSNDYAKKVAKNLFYSLAHPDGYFGKEEDDTKSLDVSHFMPYFRDRELAIEAFKVFDKDGNGDLTRREFRDTVVQIYRERKGLAQAIRDTSQALGKIDVILLVISTLLIIVISLTIFNVSFWSALIPFGTVFLGCTFIFDTSAKALFQGILFQFVTHPYDAGDLVSIDGTYMTVENIGILGTVFIGGDGTSQYVPTAVLLTKIISNIRRSGPMGETITFNIDFRTENQLILDLREKLLEWVQSQPRDFGPGFDLRVIDILDMNQVILRVWLPHKGNWVELGKRFQRKTRFMLALKGILTEMGIRYELPAQKITNGSYTTSNTIDTTLLSNTPQDFSKQERSRRENTPT